MSSRQRYLLLRIFLIVAFRARVVWKGSANVRFGSKADIRAAKGHVRFTPESDHKSRHPQTVMSALPSRADMCGATANVRFGPEADINRTTPPNERTV